MWDRSIERQMWLDARLELERIEYGVISLKASSPVHAGQVVSLCDDGSLGPEGRGNTCGTAVWFADEGAMVARRGPQ